MSLPHFMGCLLRAFLRQEILAASAVVGSLPSVYDCSLRSEAVDARPSRCERLEARAGAAGGTAAGIPSPAQAKSLGVVTHKPRRRHYQGKRGSEDQAFGPSKLNRRTDCLTEDIRMEGMLGSLIAFQFCYGSA